MEFTVTEHTGLAGLFVASFVAATIVPMSSEVVLFGFLKLHPQAVHAAILVATIGNTAGGMTSYWLGRLAPAPRDGKSLRWLRRFGVPLVALAWLPVIGDGLCIAAGWLRLSWWWTAFFQTGGRGLRYVAIAWLASAT